VPESSPVRAGESDSEDVPEHVHAYVWDLETDYILTGSKGDIVLSEDTKVSAAVTSHNVGIAHRVPDAHGRS